MNATQLLEELKVMNDITPVKVMSFINEKVPVPHVRMNAPDIAYDTAINFFRLMRK